MLPDRSPASAPSSLPSLPHSTCSRAGGSLTMVKRISEAAAAWRGLLARAAPAATSSCAREAVRFQTVREWPAFKRFMAMGRPMSPRPMNPILRGEEESLTIYLLWGEGDRSCDVAEKL